MDGFKGVKRKHNMKLDYSSLKNAVSSLQIAVERASAAREDDMLRDAVIQRFEYTYELCWKMLKRKLEQEAANPALIDQLSYKDLIRVGAEKGYIDDAFSWFEYREARNITSHTYNLQKAEQVFAKALLFAASSRKLLDKLVARTDG